MDMKSFRPSGSVFLLLLLVTTNFLHCSGESRHYFMNEKETGGTEETGNYLGQPEYHDCFIIVKETKRIGGQCVKIRDKIQGCVAGKLMYPLHHDCM